MDDQVSRMRQLNQSLNNTIAQAVSTVRAEPGASRLALTDVQRNLGRTRFPAEISSVRRRGSTLRCCVPIIARSVRPSVPAHFTLLRQDSVRWLPSSTNHLDGVRASQSVSPSLGGRAWVTEGQEADKVRSDEAGSDASGVGTVVRCGGTKAAISRATQILCLEVRNHSGPERNQRQCAYHE